jgi:hypothetical protein
MTRFLSRALQAEEPFFSQGIRRLETASGHTRADIHLTTEIRSQARSKLPQLGLDHNDTTAEELYHALQQRVKVDDAKLIKKLRSQAAKKVSAEADVVAGMVHVLNEVNDSKRCFALKTSRFKAIVKTQPPRRAMRALGYRSVDSFLKHESPASIMTAANLSESPSWHKKLHDQYKKLSAGDFESRSIQIIKSDSKLDNFAAQAGKNLISLRELGVLVILPLSSDVPPGAVTASLCTALHELNEIRASSSFLKLSQVRTGFGSLVQSVADSEPTIKPNLLTEPVSWSLIHRYYSCLADHFRQEVFEPYVQLEDMAWHPIEQTLTSIEASFSFWVHSGHLGFISQDQPVSLNVVDAALNCCNQLSFEKRVNNYFQRSLWHELLIRYFKPSFVEKSILAEVQPQLAEELVEV